MNTAASSKANLYYYENKLLLLVPIHKTSIVDIKVNTMSIIVNTSKIAMASLLMKGLHCIYMQMFSMKIQDTEILQIVMRN